MAVRVSCYFLLTVIAVLSASINAVGVVLVNDQFLETGTLAGKAPMPGPGAAWNPGAQTGINAVTVVNTSSSPANNEVALVQTEATNGEDIANVFADRSTTATTYARFDFRLPSADNTTLGTDADILAEGLFFVTLRGTSASTTQRGRVGFVVPAAGGDFRMAINADNSNLVAGATFPLDLAFDTTHRAVVSFDASTAKSQLWIDPLDESSTSVEHTGAGTSIGTIINRIILRQHNSYNGKQFVDNVVVATTFSEALNPSLPGDYNGDGMVDGADYVMWRKTPSAFGGDLAGYNTWRANFGNPPGSGSGLGTFSAVPEPTITVLIASLCAITAFRRNRCTNPLR